MALGGGSRMTRHAEAADHDLPEVAGPRAPNSGGTSRRRAGPSPPARSARTRQSAHERAGEEQPAPPPTASAGRAAGASARLRGRRARAQRQTAPRRARAPVQDGRASRERGAPERDQATRRPRAATVAAGRRTHPPARRRRCRQRQAAARAPGAAPGSEAGEARRAHAGRPMRPSDEPLDAARPARRAARRQDGGRDQRRPDLDRLAVIGAGEQPGAEPGLGAGRQLADDGADQADRDRAP